MGAVCGFVSAVFFLVARRWAGFHCFKVGWGRALPLSALPFVLGLRRSSLACAVRPFFGFFSLGSSYLCVVAGASFSPVGAVLPPVVSALLAGASSVGFSGSRSVVPPSFVSALVFGAVSPSALVSVGCARGFDSLVRSAFPSCVVWWARAFGVGRASFARRSSAFVRSLACSSGSVLVSFPAVACPAGLLPSASASACFGGFGSGSWAGVALAVGLGVPVVLWLPVGVVPPASFGFVPAGGGFFVFRPSQGRLF